MKEITCPTEILDLLKLIDFKFKTFKGEVSRLSTEWGGWSRDMNLKIREKVDSKHEYKDYYGYLFIYWVNRSQLLEFSLPKYKLFKQGKRRKLAKEGEKVKEIILYGEPNPTPFDDFMSLVKGMP